MKLKELIAWYKRVCEERENCLYVLGYEFIGWELANELFAQLCKETGFDWDIIWEALEDFTPDFTEEDMWKLLATVEIYPDSIVGVNKNNVWLDSPFK